MNTISTIFVSHNNKQGQTKSTRFLVFILAELNEVSDPDLDPVFAIDGFRKKCGERRLSNSISSLISTAFLYDLVRDIDIRSPILSTQSFS